MEPAAEKKIAALQGELVRIAEGLVDDKLAAEDNFDTQLRNLIDVSASAECPEVVVNYVRYQIARQWKKPAQRDFGDNLIKLLDRNAKPPSSLLKLCSEVPHESADKDRLVVALARSMLGYANRHYKWANKVKKPKK